MKGCLMVVAISILSAVAVKAQDAPVRPGNGVSLPMVVKEVKPTYTPEAQAAKIEGSVIVEAVVTTNGTVGDVRVVQSLDTKYGLDDQALKAAKQWIFKPGMKDGQPVAVQIAIELTFHLRTTK